MWILTKEINEYYQEGAYFVCAFESKPSVDTLSSILKDERLAIHLSINGGGRVGVENEWYYLKEYSNGELNVHLRYT